MASTKINTLPTSSFSSSRAPIGRRRVSPYKLDLKRLTSRVVQLTRRKQLHQIMDEIDAAKGRHGKLNTIAMNAVLEACVHCKDIDSVLKVFDEMSKPLGCGVDAVSYAVLLKGLGEAGRIDEAFQLLEFVEQGTAVGKPKLSGPLLFGLLNALVESGDVRRANGLLSRYGFFLREGGSASVTAYNLLMKGHIKMGSPEGAIAMYSEILRLGLSPDRLTYNTLISACVKTNKLDLALHFFEEMKESAQNLLGDIFPDAVTYTTLLKGFGSSKDLPMVHKIVSEMKLQLGTSVDRTAFTATVDALLNCGAIRGMELGALCVFGEMVKLSGWNKDLRPKPHLYLSMMRAFSVRGEYDIVKTLNRRICSDTSGTISLAVQEETDHLLMEAALNNGQVGRAIDYLSYVIKKWRGISWTSRGGMVALQIEALLGSTKSTLCPYLLPKVSVSDPIEKFMVPFEAAKPLHVAVELKRVVMRFFRDPVVPIKDDRGSCIGLLHRKDCKELDAPVWTMMKGPPPTVTTTATMGHVVDLLMQKSLEMVIVVNHDGSFSRPVGFFASGHLGNLITTESNSPKEKPFLCRTV